MALFGIINVNKPKGLTSHDVVSRLRKILKIKQIGHTGTLDPMATGVLPICVGKATKLIQYLDNSKAYRAYIKLGMKSDTYDIEGQITEENKVSFDLDKIQSILTEFKGEITQKPPMYSAVHYKGKRLYEYARKNIEILDIPERKVFINKIELIDVLDKNSEHPVLIVDIVCSAGTYIRSIANDAGLKLGYGALLSDLARTKAGKFFIDNCVSLEDIKESYETGNIDNIIINPINILDIKQFKIDESLLEKIKNGQPLRIQDNNNFSENEKVLLVLNNSLIAVSEFREDKIFPTNVFI